MNNGISRENFVFIDWIGGGTGLKGQRPVTALVLVWAEVVGSSVLSLEQPMTDTKPYCPL